MCVCKGISSFFLYLFIHLLVLEVLKWIKIESWPKFSLDRQHQSGHITSTWFGLEIGTKFELFIENAHFKKELKINQWETANKFISIQPRLYKGRDQIKLLPQGNHSDILFAWFLCPSVELLNNSGLHLSVSWMIISWSKLPYFLRFYLRGLYSFFFFRSREIFLKQICKSGSLN